MKTLLTFYQRFVWPLNLLNVMCCMVFTYVPPLAGIAYTFWMKVITMALIGIYFEIFHSQQLLFFYNLGYSKRTLYTAVAAFDFAIWAILSAITIIATG
ncbi:MAG TPA: hypothetical protein VK508_00940 [Cyclobacteriaceae bacterium]|nr:hypothetical protein [Cyclobacteriaceae bacterium]